MISSVFFDIKLILFLIPKFNNIGKPQGVIINQLIFIENMIDNNDLLKKLII